MKTDRKGRIVLQRGDYRVNNFIFHLEPNHIKVMAISGIVSWRVSLDTSVGMLIANGIKEKQDQWLCIYASPPNSSTPRSSSIRSSTVRPSPPTTRRPTIKSSRKRRNFTKNSKSPASNTQAPLLHTYSPPTPHVFPVVVVVRGFSYPEHDGKVYKSVRKSTNVCESVNFVVYLRYL